MMIPSTRLTIDEAIASQVAMGTDAPTLTFRAHLAVRSGDITIRVLRVTDDEVTGVRLPTDRHGHGEKTWRRDEITLAALVAPTGLDEASLHEAFLEGSPSAYIELARRHKLPQSAALQPAWL